jgi:hypothetical protein
MSAMVYKYFDNPATRVKDGAKSSPASSDNRRGGYPKGN